MAPSPPAVPRVAASLALIALVACGGTGTDVLVEFQDPTVKLSTDTSGRVRLDGSFDFTAWLAPWAEEDDAEVWLDKLDVTASDDPFRALVTDIRVPDGASFFPVEVDGDERASVRVPFTGASLKAPGDELAWLCSIGRPMELQGLVYDIDTSRSAAFYDSAALQADALAHEIRFSREDPAALPLAPRRVWTKPQIGGGGFLPWIDVKRAWGGTILAGELFETLNLDDRFVTADGAGDAFVVRLDAEGKVVWANTFGDIGEDGISSIAGRADGDLFVGGHFANTIDLGAGAILNSTGGYGSFVARMSEAGTATWSAGFVDQAEFSVGDCNRPNLRVAARPDGGVGLVKSLLGTVELGGTLTASFPADTCSADLLVAAYDAAGGLLHASRFGDNFDQQGLDIAVDAAGITWVVGFNVGVLDLGNGLLPLTGPGLLAPRRAQLFVAAFDPQGTPIVARDLGWVLLRADTQVRIAARPGGGAVVAGLFTGQIASGAQTLTSTGPGDDGFVVAIDAAGAPLWGQHFDHAGSSLEAGFKLGDVAVTEDGRVVLVGRAASLFTVGGKPLPGGNQPIFGAGMSGALFGFVLGPDGAPLGYRILACNAGLSGLDVGDGEVTLLASIFGYAEAEGGALLRNDSAFWIGRLPLDP